MTEQEQKSTQQRVAKSTVRKKAYGPLIEKYPLYSTLLVLKDYEDQELYEECAIIRDALKDYKKTYEEKLPKGVKFPTHLSVYKGEEHQNMLLKHDIVVSESLAIEKAKMIKIKLPL